MKELHGTASAATAATAEGCFALLSELESYPSWYPDGVRAVRILDRDSDGWASRAQVTLHVAAGPIVRDFTLLLAVDVRPPSTIRLDRLADEPSDQERFSVEWRIRANAETVLELGLDAVLSVPRLLPVGGLGDTMARGFVQAAVEALAKPA